MKTVLASELFEKRIRVVRNTEIVVDGPLLTVPSHVQLENVKFVSQDAKHGVNTSVAISMMRHRGAVNNVSFHGFSSVNMRYPKVAFKNLTFINCSRIDLDQAEVFNLRVDNNSSAFKMIDLDLRSSKINNAEITVSTAAVDPNAYLYLSASTFNNVQFSGVQGNLGAVGSHWLDCSFTACRFNGFDIYNTSRIQNCVFTDTHFAGFTLDSALGCLATRFVSCSFAEVKIFAPIGLEIRELTFKDCKNEGFSRHAEPKYLSSPLLKHTPFWVNGFDEGLRRTLEADGIIHLLDNAKQLFYTK